MAAFRVGSNTLLTRLFVMTGEVRLVGERTPNLPEGAEMAAVAAVICGPSVVDRLGAVGQCARSPSAGENGSSPRCVWMSAWQVVAVAGKCPKWAARQKTVCR